MPNAIFAVEPRLSGHLYVAKALPSDCDKTLGVESCATGITKSTPGVPYEGVEKDMAPKSDNPREEQWRLSFNASVRVFACVPSLW